MQYRLAPTMDGLYTPYALRLPDGTGPHPFVFLAYGNGGGGLPWLRDRIVHYGHVMDRLLDAGYACAWGRYRSEVELGYHTGGPLVRDRRQGMDLFNRSPLEFEDEVAILRRRTVRARHRRRNASATWGSATPGRCCSRSPRRTRTRSRPGSRASRPTTSSSTSTPARPSP